LIGAQRLELRGQKGRGPVGHGSRKNGSLKCDLLRMSKQNRVQSDFHHAARRVYDARAHVAPRPALEPARNVVGLVAADVGVRERRAMPFGWIPALLLSQIKR
jgi:hypothetical protein